MQKQVIIFLALFLFQACVSAGDGRKIESDIFQLQTRLMEMESQMEKGGKNHKSQTDGNSKQIVQMTTNLEALKSQQQQIRGDIDLLKVAVRTGQFPGSSPDAESFAKVLARMREQIAALEQTQGIMLEKMGQTTPKKGKSKESKALQTLAQLEELFNQKKYQGILEDAPLLIEKLDGSSKAQARYLYAESLFKAGKLSDAALAFNSLLDDQALTEIKPQIQMRLGDSFRLLGEEKVAAVYYSELIEKFPESEAAQTAKNHLTKLEKVEKK